jgi:DNA-binding XRE family transcriptional regulator
MLTRQQLADLLQSVRVEDLAREANVATKTIYRLRKQENVPTLETARRLADAVERIRRAAKVAA